MEDNVKSIITKIVADIWDDIDVRADVRAFIDFINKNYTWEERHSKYFATALAGVMSELFDNKEIQKNQKFIPAPLYFYMCALQKVSNISIVHNFSNEDILSVAVDSYFGKLESGISFDTITLENEKAVNYFTKGIKCKNTPLTINQLNINSHDYLTLYAATSKTHVTNCKCMDDLTLDISSDLQIDNLILMPGGKIKEAKYIDIISGESFESIDVSHLPYDINIEKSLLRLVSDSKIKKIYKRDGQKILCPKIVDVNKRPIVEVK